MKTCLERRSDFSAWIDEQNFRALSLSHHTQAHAHTCTHPISLKRSLHLSLSVSLKILPDISLEYFGQHICYFVDVAEFRVQ